MGNGSVGECTKLAIEVAVDLERHQMFVCCGFVVCDGDSCFYCTATELNWNSLFTGYCESYVTYLRTYFRTLQT